MNEEGCRMCGTYLRLGKTRDAGSFVVLQRNSLSCLMLEAPALAILGCFPKIRKIILERRKLKVRKLFKGLKNTLRAES